VALDAGACARRKLTFEVRRHVAAPIDDRA